MAYVRSTVPSIRFSGDARPTTSRSSSRSKESRAPHSTQRSRTTSSHIIHRHRRRRLSLESTSLRPPVLRPQLNRDPLAFTTIPEMTEIVPFQPSDYDDAMALWRQTEGLALRGADSREAVLHYLKRNPGTSFVARERRTLLGAVLGGHDGRRGYLHHLAVAPSHRRRGVGRAL